MKGAIKKKRTFQEVTSATPTIAIEETTPANDLRSILEETKNQNGVIGYILRNTTSASIDLKDPAKIIEYALLSSSALDASNELSQIFDLGEVKSVLVEGKNSKMLCLTIYDNKVSVFMEKDVNAEEILKKIAAS